MRRFLALFALFFLISGSAHAEVIERIVAIVNDEPITLSDLRKFEERLRKGTLVDDLLVPDETTKQALLKDRNLLLQKLIEEKIIDTEVKKQKLTVPIETVEQEIRSIARKNGLSREELKAVLQQQGVNFSEYQDFIKRGLERQNLIKSAVISRVKVSEDDVLAEYVARHGASNDQAFEYTISHIYFRAGPSGGALARSRAESALKRLRNGESFERLAAEVSEDPAFEEGGLLGVFKTGELNKDLEAALKKLNAGEYTGVLPTSGGYHIVKLNKKRLIPDPRTEREREKIRAELYEKAHRRQFRLWLDNLRQEAFIRINK